MTLTPRIFMILGLLVGLTPLAIDAYLPSIPTIANDLDKDISYIQLTLSVYLLAFALLQVVFGPLSDALGRRPVITFGIIVFIFGSIVCAIAQSYDMLILGRIIQAIGGAGVAVSIPALVKDGLAENEFVKAMGMVMLVMALAPLAAPIIGGGILVALSWHFIFVFLAVLALVALWLFLKSIPETLPIERRTPLSFKNVMVTYKRLASHKLIMGYILSGAFHFAGLMCLITGGAFLYIELYHVNEAYFGFYMGVNVISMMIATTLNRRYVDRLGLPKLTVYGVHVLTVAGLILFTLSWFDLPPLAAIMLACMLYTGTMGVLGGGLMAGAMRYAGRHNGSVNALAGTFRFTAGAAAGAVVSALHDGSATPLLTTMAGCAACAIGIWYWTVRTERLKPMAPLQ